MEDGRAQVISMPQPRRGRRWKWIVGILALLVIVAAIGVRIVIARAQPILRARVIETLSARFKSRVELAELHVWVTNGLHVEGKGLQIYGLTDPNPWEAGVQPLLEIGEFRFQTALSNLFREPMNVDTIYVSGLTMNIPPKDDRKQMTNFRKGGGKMKISVDHFVCTDTKLLINTNKPGKAPLEFDIGDLRMKDIGPGQPLRFEATLINPKPVGNIQSTGSFGPLNEESPRDSAVNGDYSFTQADLGTIKGIGGILSSTGKYAGTLGHIVVDGQTDTPDFQVAVSGHPVPLHTDFHAIVDGTDGDTYLEPVKATVLHSSFTASGKIVRMKEPLHGHDIELNVVLGHATIEDLLKLGVKTDPPIMTGTVAMKTKLSLPPGPADVANRLKLAGTFHIPQGFFTNEKLQGRIDSFSMRSLGKHTNQNDQEMASVRSDLQGKFTLDQGLLSFSFLHFQIPGTHADMTGDYSLDGNTFDFHGLLRLDAKLSQMTTGWKSILLKPVDPFFQKHGAGTEVPFKVTGTRSEPHFGLDFGHKDEQPPKSQGEAGASR
jgi:AsmA-like C-terminal region